MAVSTIAVTTSGTDVNGVWRKVQAPLQEAAQFMIEEYDLLEELKTFDVDWSAREITVPLDLRNDYGVASIAEGGYEARPVSPNVVDATISWVLYNARFTATMTAKWIAQRNSSAMLENQLMYQGRKKLQAIARRIGQDFYGFSTGVQAEIATAYSGGNIIIDSAYGVTGLGADGDNRQASDLFEEGDFIVVLDDGTPATIRGSNSISVDTITRATQTLAVSADPTGDLANDFVVFANNIGTTSTESVSEYNRGMSGLLDIVTSTTLHSVSSATEPEWAAYANTAGGRFDGVKLRTLKQAITNDGGGKLTNVLWSQGIENDVFALQAAGIRFGDPFNLELDGTPKSRGIKFTSTQRVPDGYLFGWDKKTFKKLQLLNRPGKPAWEDGYKLQDQSGYVFPIDYPTEMITLNRANFGYFSGLTEQ